MIADSIELVGRGHMFDAMVTIVGCDKTIPAAAMAHARLGVPGAIVYSGSIAPAASRARRDVQEVFEGSALTRRAGCLMRTSLIWRNACPGARRAVASTRRTPWR